MPYTYKYPRPMVTVDVVVFSPDLKKVVLVRRAREPFKGQWALPGGFVGIDEELEAAARRELHEETGLSGVSLEQVYTFDTLCRDPRGRVITVAHAGIADPEKTRLRAASDARAVKWFDMAGLPGLTFDHGLIVSKALDHMKK